ncbi:hypothetical protein PF002_g26674 [Phytophthora fragariae]|nr:hypothetical protein PF002_g26674 [Phytophthora fragariae]
MRGLGELPHVVFRVDAFLDVYSGPDAVVDACERGGSLRLLTYLAARDTESFWGKVAVYAAMHGYVYILQWLSDAHADRCEWGVDVLDSAAGLGHFSAVHWLHTHRSDGCTTRAMDHAAGRGYLSIHKGTLGHALRTATMNGHIPVINWLLASIDDGRQHEIFTRLALKLAKKSNQWRV